MNRWHARRRPPWWPEGESWPPERHARRFLLWRVAFPLVLAVVLLTLCSITFSIGFAVASVVEAGRATGRPIPMFAPWIVIPTVMVVLLIVFSGVRRLSPPVPAWLDVAGRIEAGDFTARVPEQGPRQIRRVARAFNQMASRLQAQDEARRQVLADITHELRTPLTVIQGQIEGVLDGIYPPDADHLGPALEEARVLARLIEDLRTLSLAESGALNLRTEPTDLAALLGDTLSAFHGQASAAGIALGTEIPAALRPISADPVRLREVFSNLLANAIRYTPPGGSVLVSVRDEPARIVVQIANTGKGIAPEVLSRMFDRFYRTPDSPGTGLGLAITRDLVEAHGGTVRAVSEPDQGTMVEVVLPRREP